MYRYFTSVSAAVFSSFLCLTQTLLLLIMLFVDYDYDKNCDDTSSARC